MGGNHVQDRLFCPCPGSSKLDFDEQILHCTECDFFYYRCCACSKRKEKPCHLTSVVFTDGACSNNGQDGASAGCGIALGPNDNLHYSMPMGGIDLKTSQRAELLAAYKGLELAMDGHKLNRERVTSSETDCKSKHVVIMTDSEYVCKGMTEWLPKWQSNGFRTSTGEEPSNLDLFLRIDRKIRKYETDEFSVGFMHIPRQHNKLADKLAKRAAEIDREM